MPVYHVYNSADKLVARLTLRSLFDYYPAVNTRRVTAQLQSDGESRYRATGGNRYRVVDTVLERCS